MEYIIGTVPLIYVKHSNFTHGMIVHFINQTCSLIVARHSHCLAIGGRLIFPQLSVTIFLS